MPEYIGMYSCATYYFSSGGDSEGNGSGEVMEGVKTGHTKHFGSIALGSLILALIKTLE